MRLVADSSVWVDYLRGAQSGASQVLDDAIGSHEVLVGDLILAEVLRGVPDEKTAKLVLAALDRFEVVPLVGKALAIQAAENYRILRSKAITVRGTIDLLIGTWCIVNRVPLLHADRDFDGMEKWLGLRRWTGL